MLTAVVCGTCTYALQRTHTLKQSGDSNSAVPLPIQSLDLKELKMQTTLVFDTEWLDCMMEIWLTGYIFALNSRITGQIHWYALKTFERAGTSLFILSMCFTAHARFLCLSQFFRFSHAIRLIWKLIIGCSSLQSSFHYSIT